MGASNITKSMPQNPALQTIDFIAARYNVSLRTLRFYEQMDLIRPTRVGTRRLYSAKDEVRLQIILKGRRLGFALREIREMIADIVREPESDNLVDMLTQNQIAEQLQTLERQRDEISSAIDELRAARH